ncbi:MAG: class I SAM-dependent methyltransferase [Nitrospirota bacterium]
MTEFNKSNWAKAGFSQQYIDKADIYIVERRRMFGLLVSFYNHFLRGKPNRILDLGCGDGILAHELLKVDDAISATLVDGSADMLRKTRERLKDFKSVQLIKASFQELLAKDFFEPGFDLVFSSLAIHHLTTDEKSSMFGKIYSWLNYGGYFVNIDVVLASDESLDSWYLKLWQEWMDDRKAAFGISDSISDDIIRRYKDNKDNKPDTLDDQLDALKGMGFQEVDCFYKYGIFSIYGGRKSENLSG